MLTRRALLLGLAAAPIGCSRSQPQRDPRSEDPRWKTLDFPGEGNAAQRALVLDAEHVADRPLLIALHGRGESGRGLDVGARAWRDDYELGHLDDRLRKPPLTADDFGSFVRPDRLSRVNASLASTPYKGLCVACPHTPDLPDRSPAGVMGYASFLLQKLVPAIAGSAPEATRENIGIDGVSLGGRIALLVGVFNPRSVRFVGALQPAIRMDEVAGLASLLLAARAERPQRVRLVSSDDDPFLPAVRALSERLGKESFEHEFLVVPGPHDYAWNRGAGGLEMLLWHERVQRGLPAP